MRRYKRGKGGKDAPPDNADRKNEARSETICQTPPHRLKKSIAGQHRTENLAKFHIAETVGIGDRPARDGDVDAVKVRHGTENE